MSDISFNDYQKNALRTAVENGVDLHSLGEDSVARFALGVSDEAGEVSGAVKKYLRGDYGKDELRRRVYDEMGDVLWYLAVVADCLDLKFGDIAVNNNEKLARRHEEGTIHGDGER